MNSGATAAHIDSPARNTQSDGFLSQESQLETIQKLSEKHHLGFSDELFAEARKNANDPDHGKPTISVWFPRLESPHITISYAMSMVREVAKKVGDEVYEASPLKGSQQHFKLYEEEGYDLSLCRYDIDVHANCGQSVNSVRKVTQNPNQLLTCAGLWIYYHSPEFVRSMPQILFSGFQFKRNFNGFNDWKFALSMRHASNGKSELEFDVICDDSKLPQKCVPVVEQSIILTG